MSGIANKKAKISGIIFLIAIIAITIFLVVFTFITVGKPFVIHDFEEMEQATVEDYKELGTEDYYVIVYNEDSYKHDLIKEVVIEYANYARTTESAIKIYAMNYQENLDICNSNHLNISSKIDTNIPTLIKISNNSIVSADTKITVSTINETLVKAMNK